MQVPVYLITGFLESGKTTFIEQVILEGNFVEDEKTLLILTEEGEAEIDPKLLEQYNVDVVTVDEKEDFTVDFLKNAAASIALSRLLSNITVCGRSANLSVCSCRIDGNCFRLLRLLTLPPSSCI